MIHRYRVIHRKIINNTCVTLLVIFGENFFMSIIHIVILTEFSNPHIHSHSNTRTQISKN